MKKIFITMIVAVSMLIGTGVYADHCAGLNKDIQDIQGAIAHIKEHGKIAPEDAAEASRDLKQTKKDLEEILSSGEAPGEEADMIKRAIAAIAETRKGLKKNDMERVVGGLEGIVAVMIEYRDHHKCSQ